MHIKVFFISLFLFSKIFMSKYNIYFLKKIVNECYETRTEKKNAKKIKIPKSQKCMSIFPPLLRLLRFFTAQQRLGQFFGVLLG